jgi:hypothetical protein
MAPLPAERIAASRDLAGAASRVRTVVLAGAACRAERAYPGRAGRGTSAFALLRCGTPADFERDPLHRLRLTIGLAKVKGRWIVTHEHHSFADATGT